MAAMTCPHSEDYFQRVTVTLAYDSLCLLLRRLHRHLLLHTLECASRPPVAVEMEKRGRRNE